MQFKLYAAPNCEPPVHRQDVNIEATDRPVQLKAAWVKDGPDAPEPIEIRHVLTGMKTAPVL